MCTFEIPPLSCRCTFKMLQLRYIISISLMRGDPRSFVARTIVVGQDVTTPEIIAKVTLGLFMHCMDRILNNYSNQIKVVISASLLLAARNLNRKCVLSRPRVHKSQYWGEMLQVPHPLLWRNVASLLARGELCTSPLHCKLLFVYIVCCQRTGQCFSVLRTRHTDVVDRSSGRSYITEQWHNVPLLHTRDLDNG